MAAFIPDSVAGMFRNTQYLDYNCFQRSFDDQAQARIRMETIACGEIFAKAETGDVELAWSFMHEDENAISPFLDRKAEVIKLSELCRVRLAPSERMKSEALALQGKNNLSAKDALHVACAFLSNIKFFLTCDDRVIKRTGGQIGDMVVMNRITYVVRER